MLLVRGGLRLLFLFFILLIPPPPLIKGSVISDSVTAFLVPTQYKVTPWCQNFEVIDLASGSPKNGISIKKCLGLFGATSDIIMRPRPKYMTLTTESDSPRIQ